MRMATLAILLMGLCAGCSYNVQPVSAKAINVYSSYDDKIPGTFVVVIDSSVTNVDREIKPATYVCSAHKYPIVLGDSIAVSIKNTLNAVFEQTIVQSTTPSREAMESLGVRGVVLVRMDDFSPRLACATGFWSGTCSGSTDVSFGVHVRGHEGILLATSVAGSKTADGDSGGNCEGGASILSESITRSTRDALERLAERLSNAPRLRTD